MGTALYGKSTCVYCGRMSDYVYYNDGICLACSYELYDYEGAIHDMWRVGWRRDEEGVVYFAHIDMTIYTLLKGDENVG